MQENQESMKLSLDNAQAYNIRKNQKVILQNEELEPISTGKVQEIIENDAVIKPTSEMKTDQTATSFIPNGIPAKALEDPSPSEKAYGPGPARKVSSEPTKVAVLIAGGGMGGSSLFRYFSEAGFKPILINEGQGSSWRNIAGGRSNFSLPELSEIAVGNQEIFKELQSIRDVGYRESRYVTFAHDDEMYAALEKSMEWTKARMVTPDKFQQEISPFINPKLDRYQAALIADNCWQGIPGMVISLIRELGVDSGGTLFNDTKLVDVEKKGDNYLVTVKHNTMNQIEQFECEHFVNALGAGANNLAKKVGLDLGLYAAVHQAFITKPLPQLGLNGDHLPMMIERRKYKSFSALYAQQFGINGQIIGCVSPAHESTTGGRTINSTPQEFVEYVSEMLAEWIPSVKPLALEAVWSGCYIEPRMFVDPEHGLFAGLKGHGFMQSQYLAKLYVESFLGREVPSYFKRLSLNGDGLVERIFK